MTPKISDHFVNARMAEEKDFYYRLHKRIVHMIAMIKIIVQDDKARELGFEFRVFLP